MRSTIIGRAANRALTLAAVVLLGTGLFAGAATAEDAAGPAADPVTIGQGQNGQEPTDDEPAGQEPGAEEPTGDEPAEQEQPQQDPAGSEPGTEPNGGPASEERDAGIQAGADLVLDVDVQDRSYVVGEDVPVHVTITNTGDTVAQGVKGSEWTLTPDLNFFVQSHYWGEFGRFGPGGPSPGGTVDPGETVELELVGTVDRIGGDALVRFNISATNDADTSDNAEQITIRFVPESVTADVTGRVFGDLDGDGAYDAGEGLAGVEVWMYGFLTNPTTQTDSAGAFRFDDLPSKRYSINFHNVPDGWVIPYVQAFLVDGSSGPVDTQIVAYRPLTDVLSAAIEFTAETYRPGDVAGLRLTLTNSGHQDVTGIMAGCDRAGMGPHIALGPEWDQFGYGSPGVTVPAGQSRVFELTGTVPDSAHDHGYVSVGCDFGNDERLIEGFPVATDRARVPGLIVDGVVRLWSDTNGNGMPEDGEHLAGVRVGVVDTYTDSLVAKATTDADGRATFADLPAGRYLVRVYGPWRLVEDAHGYLYVGNCGTCHEAYLEVEPGPEVPEDPDPVPPTTPPTTAPPPQGGATPGGGGGLASTGASVIGLSVAGLIAVALGFAAVLFGRRRREAA